MQVELLSQFEIVQNREEIDKAIRAVLSSQPENVEGCWRNVLGGGISVYGLWKEDRVFGYLFTSMVKEGENLALLIYGLWSEGGSEGADWDEGIDFVVNVARRAKCFQIQAVTENSKVEAMLKKHGWTVKRMCWLNLKQDEPESAADVPAQPQKDEPVVTIPK